jgi:hypothetical protein
MISNTQNSLYLILIIGIIFYSLTFFVTFIMAVNKLKSKYLASIFLMQILPYIKIN